MLYTKENKSLWLLPDWVVQRDLLQLAEKWRQFHQLPIGAPNGHDILHAIHWESPDSVGEAHIDVAEAALNGHEFNPLATFLQEEGSEWVDSLERVYKNTQGLHPVVKRVIKKSGLITK